jgi:tetratricopeptide (TPR) repeat protein
MNWPQETILSTESQAIYEHGMDMLNMYRGHPQVLVDALKVFQDCGSQAYAAAGCASALMISAYESGDDYSAEGLELARPWLIKAQELAPNHVEIDFLEAELYIYLRQNEFARSVLDYLNTADGPKHFYLCLSELYYWYAQKNQEQYQHWYDLAILQATNKGRQICLLSRAAGFFLALEEWKKVIGIYRDLAALDPEDPWLWHNVSLAYYHLERYDKAQQANKKALEIMDFEVAREMEALLKNKLSF